MNIQTNEIGRFLRHPRQGRPGRPGRRRRQTPDLPERFLNTCERRAHRRRSKFLSSRPTSPGRGSAMNCAARRRPPPVQEKRDRALFRSLGRKDDPGDGFPGVMKLAMTGGAEMEAFFGQPLRFAHRCPLRRDLGLPRRPLLCHFPGFFLMAGKCTTRAWHRRSRRQISDGQGPSSGWRPGSLGAPWRYGTRCTASPRRRI